MSIRLRSMVAVTLVISASCFGGTTLHVSPTGSDSNSGSSLATALKTIDAAVANTSAGDEVCVHPGTYQSSSGYVASMSGNNIHIYSDKGSSVTILDGQGLRGCCRIFNTINPGLRITGLTFLNGSAPTDTASGASVQKAGGGVRMFDSDAVFTDCVFESCSAMDSGGAVFIGQASAVFVDCEFIKNVAGKGGGAISVWNDATDLTLSGCLFQGNTAGINGGAIRASSSVLNLQLDDCLIGSNTAVGNGGGMAVDHALAVSVSNSWFAGCEAEYGGGLYLNNTSAQIIDTILESNVATETGGGMKAQEAEVFLFGGSVHSNHAQYGAGIYARESNLEVSPGSDSAPTTFSANSATSGGGIYIQNETTAKVDGATFQFNHALNNGGGIRVDVDCLATVTQTQFTENSAAVGGAVHNNLCDSSSSLTNCVFTGNNAGTVGGAVRNYGSSPTIESCLFESNTSGGNGGAIANAGFGTTDSSPTITDSQFNANHAQYGGAIENQTGSDPKISQCQLLNNTAALGGGGVFNIGNVSPEFIEVVFTGNSSGLGGGAHNASLAQPQFNDCDFIGNRANLYGGGMYNSDATPVLDACLFKANVAEGLDNTGMTGYGGAIANWNNTQLGAYNCQFDLNSARIGGAIYSVASGLDIMNSQVSRNEAGLGAGLFNDAGTYDVNRNGDEYSGLLLLHVTDNVAAQAGGGMYSKEIGASGTGLTVGSTTFEGNQANDGGGLYNKAVGSLLEFKACVINSNTANLDGGGMANNDASPTINNSTFTNNVAAGYGGGIYNSNSSRPRFNQSKVCYNQSALMNGGGGVFSTGDSWPQFIDTTVCLNTPNNIVGPLLGAVIESCVDDGNCEGNIIDDGGNPDDGIDTCLGDSTQDGRVDLEDFTALLTSWGSQGPSASDFDQDGVVGLGDFTILLIGFGTECSTQGDPGLPGDPRSALSQQVDQSKSLKQQPVRRTRKQR
ncbi:MAG: hypothetical protein P8J86_04975 [Phycisphaerales bacterium]|nr:hypothetical protein [Phycisphaerales bacterium]